MRGVRHSVPRNIAVRSFYSYAIELDGKWGKTSLLQKVDQPLGAFEELRNINHLVINARITDPTIPMASKRLEQIADVLKQRSPDISNRIYLSNSFRLAFLSQMKGNYAEEIRYLEQCHQYDTKKEFTTQIEESKCVAMLNNGESSKSSDLIVRSLQKRILGEHVTDEFMGKLTTPEEQICKVRLLISNKKDLHGAIELCERLIHSVERTWLEPTVGLLLCKSISQMGGYNQTTFGLIEKILNSCVKNAETLFGKESLYFLSTLGDIAEIYKLFGDAVFAEGLYNTCIPKMRRMERNTGEGRLGKSSILFLEYARCSRSYTNMLKVVSFNGKTREREADRLWNGVMDDAKRDYPDLMATNSSLKRNIDLWEYEVLRRRLCS